MYNKTGDSKLLTLEAQENASGSCPWIFPWDGTDYVKDNDIYSVARYPAGEYRDYYKLSKPLIEQEGKYKLEIREIESEESFSDFVNLIAVDHANDVEIAPDNFGNIYAFKPANLIAPVSAVSNTNTNVLNLIDGNDEEGFHAYSESYVDIDFGDIDVSQGARLLLRVKGFNDDGLGAYMPFIGPPAIVVKYLSSEGEWTELGRLKPRFEWDECMFDLSSFLPDYSGDVKVRLYCISHGQKYHIVDYVAIESGPEPAKTIVPQKLSLATFYGNSVIETLTASDNNYVHMKAGNHIPIEFDATPGTDQKRTFIFVSEGYYIPRGSTYFIYTWDGANWINRDAYSYTNTDETKVYDLSLFLPDPDGEYKVRVWQDYTGGYSAAIDYVDFEVGSLNGTLTSATDLRNSQDVLTQVKSSDDIRFTLSSGFGYTGRRDRWSQFVWTDLPTNYPPSANNLSIEGTTLSWTYADNENDPQTKAEVEIWTSAGGLGTLIWDPALIEGTQTQITYNGSDLVSGQEYFCRVKVSDGTNWSAWKEISFKLFNNPPVAENDSFQVYCGETVSGNLLNNDSDTEANDFDVAQTPTVSQGSFDSFNLETGDFVYRAPVDYAGEVTFSYQTTDGALSNLATVSIDVVDTIIPTLIVPDNIHAFADANKCGTAISFEGEFEDVVQTYYNLNIKDYTPGVNKTTWQSFIPEETGLLTKVRLSLAECSDMIFTFYIYEGQGISGKLLFKKDYNLGNLCAGWFDIALPLKNAPFVTAGNTYTFCISGLFGSLLGDSWARYTQGEFYSSYYGARNWDLRFITYMSEGVIASDNAGNAELLQTSGFSSGAIFPVGETINTYVATDASGNKVEKSFIVTVDDNVKPVVSVNNFTVYLNSSGVATINTENIDNGSTDNCGIDTTYISKESFNCNDLGSQNVTLTVVDIHGNEASKLALVNVADTISPEINVKDITVYLDDTGNVTIDPSEVDNGSYDNCSITNIELSKRNFDCGNIGENLVTAVVTDVAGNSSSDILKVTVIDTVTPIAKCKPVTVYLDENGFASIAEDSIDNGSNDACGITFDTDTTEFSCSDVFETNIVTLKVTDSSGNWSTCSSEIVVIDTVKPIAKCKPVAVYLDETGFATIGEDSVDNGSNDACRITFDTDTTEFSCSDVFETNIVTLKVTDSSGNWSGCTSEVTVMDTVSPFAVCQPITVYLDETGFAAIAQDSIDNGSADACGISTYYTDTTEFSCSDVFETNLVTLTVTDVYGNSSSCTSEVTVLDTIKPTVICQDITLHVGETGFAIIDSSFLDNGSYDVCGIAGMSLSKTKFIGEDTGANLVELSVADVNGNVASCISTVTVMDTVAPEVWCQDIGIVMNEDGTARIYPGFVLDSVFDAGGIASYNLDKSKFDCSNVGTNEVELIVTDFGGNTARCSANVEVYDNFAPVVLCNDLEVYLNEDGIAEVGVSMLEESSDDACGIAQKEISQSIFTDADLGDNTVNLYVIDVNGNVGSCESKVTVNDTIAPVVACNPISIWLSAGKSYQLTEEDVAALAAGSFDNATTFENLIIDVLPGTFECENIGDSIPVTVSVADKAGNQSSCETIVFVSYSAGKNLEDILVDLPAGVCETTVDYPAIFTGESCATLTLLDGLGADGVFPVGTTVETWEVALQGARDTVSFSVTVNSANAVPTLDPVADITASEDQQVVISLTGISDGGDCIAQELSISAAPDNTDLIKNTTLVYTSNESTAELELSLATNQTGEAQVVVRVTDEEGAFVTDTFMVFVQAGNHTPVLINPVADQEVEEGAALNLALSKVPGEVFTDSDGDELVWSFTVENDTVPAWMEVTETAGEFVFDFTPPTADTGCYNIIVAVEDPKGATATDTFELCVLRTITGIGNINEGLFAITMYPNPTTGKVYVENDSQSNENIAIIVFSASGSEVLRKEFRASDRIQFDLSDQVAGFYLVTIKQGERQVVKKLILDRK